MLNLAAILGSAEVADFEAVEEGVIMAGLREGFRAGIPMGHGRSEARNQFARQRLTLVDAAQTGATTQTRGAAGRHGQRD
jgi:hypothetical protein